MSSPRFSPIQLPGCTIPGNLFLAPLAGYTDRAFRELCLSYGASFTYTEMVSAEAVARNNTKTLQLMERAPGESQLGIQVFLSDPDQIRRALPRLLPCRPTLIDINCGCPVPKVVKTGAGAALMRSPERIYEIVKACTELCDIPVSVKIRSGWDASSLTYLEAASAAVDAGAVMVGLHARTRVQGYAGKADWDLIRNLVLTVPVPVIGSGDLFSPEDAVAMLTSTGCASIMFARGAIGRPTIFQETRDILEGRTRRDGVFTSKEERLQIGRLHLRKAVEYKGERIGCKEMKKHLSAYTKGLPDGSSLRNDLMRCSSVAEYETVLDGYLQDHPPE
ncbi:MAG: tRNA dihydrouridine synthase DusB [Spirochaetota bacterium]|nr:tRNA dihydrouridine synthase DusB [Spirochaetota bacterium]